MPGVAKVVSNDSRLTDDSRCHNARVYLNRKATKMFVGSEPMAVSRCLIDDARNNDTVLPVRMQVKAKGDLRKICKLIIQNYLLPTAIGPTHRQVSCPFTPSMHHTIVNGESTLSIGPRTPDFGTLSEDRRLRSYRVEKAF